MTDSTSTSSAEKKSLRHCCEVLSSVSETVIRDGTIINTGLTWLELQKIMCEGETCLFCENLKAHYHPSKSSGRTHGFGDETFDQAGSLYSSQLMLYFTSNSGDSLNMNCLHLTTAMLKSESQRRPRIPPWSPREKSTPVVKYGRDYLEVAGHLGKTIIGSMLELRRLVPEQFDPSILRDWIAECENIHGHEELHQHTAGSSLSRLLEKHRFRLINVRTRSLTTVSIPERYLALSYVWGQAQTSRRIRIRRSAYSIHNHATGEHLISEWETLPRTVREAAELVKDIGEQYLWVDAICINQSDPEDRKCLVPEMGTIYGCALATITSAADHADTGLPGFSESFPRHEHFTQISIGQQTLHLVRQAQPMFLSLEGGKWATRGWTFQEHLLSQRAVVFTKYQSYFTCAKGEQAESYLRTGRFGEDYCKDTCHSERVGKFGKLTLAAIFGLIQNYSRRQLTHVSDRFDVFMGVAKFLQPGDTSSDTCLALRGLPGQFFWESLLWNSFDDYVPRARIKTNLDRSLALPSWSWTGWEGDVVFPWGQWAESGQRAAFDVVVLDQANIFLKPTNKPDQLPYWEPWPTEPERYFANAPNVVTLHMWAPCVECHFIPTKSDKNSTRDPTGKRIECAILVHHQELVTEALDLLNGLSSKKLARHTDFLGYINRPKEDEDAQQHRHVHLMAIFPKPRDSPDLILLVQDQNDPRIVYRETRVDSFGKSRDDNLMGWVFNRSKPDTTTLWRYAKHRHIRMQ